MAISNLPRCSDCGDNAIVTFAVDGTSARLCFRCIKEASAIGERHAILRRLHDIGHNWSGPGCPVCLQERIERSVLWGDAP